MRYRTLLFVAALGQIGCNGIIDVPDNPFVVADTPESGPWTCLADLPEPPVAEGPRARVLVQACDFISSNCSTPVSGLTARLCDKKDVACTNPIQEGITDVDGLFDIEIDTPPGGFDGYLEIGGPVTLCEDPFCPPSCDLSAPDQNCMVPVYAPAMLFFNPPVVADWQAPEPLPLLAVAQLFGVVQAAGAEIDPSTGNLFITAFDCEGTRASGVTFTISDNQQEVTQLYVQDGAVTNTVLETDPTGVGGFVNVPAGFAEVEAFNDASEGVGSIGVVSRAGFMTYSALVPSP